MSNAIDRKARILGGMIAVGILLFVIGVCGPSVRSHLESTGIGQRIKNSIKGALDMQPAPRPSDYNRR